MNNTTNVEKQMSPAEFLATYGKSCPSTDVCPSCHPELPLELKTDDQGELMAKLCVNCLHEYITGTFLDGTVRDRDVNLTPVSGSIVDLALAHTDGSYEAIYRFAMQDSVSEPMIEQGLTELLTAFNPDWYKTVKADHFARSMEDSWDELTGNVIDDPEEFIRSLRDPQAPVVTVDGPVGGLGAPASDETSGAANIESTEVLPVLPVLSVVPVVPATSVVPATPKNDMGGNVEMTPVSEEKSVRDLIKGKKVVLGQEELTQIQSFSKEITVLNSVAKYGLPTPLFSSYVGEDIERLEFNVKRFQIELYKGEEKETIPFSSPTGHNLLYYMVVTLPQHAERFRDSIVYQALEQMNVIGYLNKRYNFSPVKKRERVLIAMIDISYAWVAIDGKMVRPAWSYSLEELLAEAFEDDLNPERLGHIKQRENVEFWRAADCRINNIVSDQSLFGTVSMNLADYKWVRAERRPVKTVNMLSEHNLGNGSTLRAEVPTPVYIQDERASMSISKSGPWGDYNEDVYAAIFSEIKIVHRESGQFVPGEDMSGVTPIVYRAYTASVAQKRTMGASGFSSLEAACRYYLAIGQGPKTFEEPVFRKEEVDGKMVNVLVEGAGKVDVFKASTRSMLGVAGGNNGSLSDFDNPNQITVDYYERGTWTEGGAMRDQSEHIVITNKKSGKRLVVGIAEDFYATRTDRFILNVLNKDYSWKDFMEFKHWADKLAQKEILEGNVTDGFGWVRSWVAQELRKNRAMNVHDTFQARAIHVIKGLFGELDEIADEFGADIILTDGMVKSRTTESIVNDIKKNGFQFFVIGQKKVDQEGGWFASQALQNMSLTVEEHKALIDETISIYKEAMESQSSKKLLDVFGANVTEKEESEFKALSFLRESINKEDILDEQWMKDEIASLTVRKLNKLLDSKVYLEDARTRYMIPDQLALLNASRRGSYRVTEEDAVLKANQIVAPTKVDGKYTFKTGRATSIRYPITINHEAPLLDAVAPEEYRKYIEEGKWQGVTILDCLSWSTESQSGADYDGDQDSLTWHEIIIGALERFYGKEYAGLPVLPIIDAYVILDDDGNLIDAGKGSPTYSAGTKVKEPKPLVEKNGFLIDENNNTILYNKDIFEGKNAKKALTNYMEIFVEMSRNILINGIEGTLMGTIANMAMKLHDLLSRDVLLDHEVRHVQRKLMLATTAGRWEIDRPKKGGAYLEMPEIQELFSIFEPVSFDEDDGLDNDDKIKALKDLKGCFHHLFYPIKNKKGEILSFTATKPEWLAVQKDGRGNPQTENPGTFQQAYLYAREQLVKFCEEIRADHGKKESNNIKPLVMKNMERHTYPVEQIRVLAADVRYLYDAFNTKENVRRLAEKAFKEQMREEIRRDGGFRGKDTRLMVTAKIDAKIRAWNGAGVKQFKLAKDLYRAEFKKSLYELSGKTGVDIRVIIGELYLALNGMKTESKTASRYDGKEIRFVPTSGNIALPFEVFSEEMSSLLLGKVSENPFLPLDTTFIHVESDLVEGGAVAPASTTTMPQIKVRVLNPSGKEGTVAVNRNVNVAIKPEATKSGEFVLGMSFLLNSATTTDAMEVTREETAYVGFVPEGLQANIGIYPMYVESVTFINNGTAAIIQLG